MMPSGSETLARWACAYAGAIWGLFWMPLRAMQAAGLDPIWSTALFLSVPGLVFLPLLPFRLRFLAQGGLKLQRSALLAGAAMAFYALAVTQTEVIRAMLLFYLTPLWSTLLARFVLGERITPVRGFAMALAFAGLLVITGIDVGPPLPRNLGDWLALVSGLTWAGAAVSLRLDRSSSAVDITLSFFVWATIPTLIFGVAASLGGTAPLPDAAVLGNLVWLLPILLLMVASGVFCCIWGPMHLDPGLVALLFMTEITVGTVTAALWAGEPFGLREGLGIALVTAAALVEAMKEYFGRAAVRPATVDGQR